MTTNQSGDGADWGPDSGAWEAWSRSVIQNRLAQHARGIDRADEALLREAYHDDGTVDYGSLQGSAAEFAAAIAAMHDGAPMSSHRTSNMWIAVEGHSAISESYVMAWVTLPTDGDPQPHLVGGRYLDRHSYKQVTGVCSIASMFWTGSPSFPRPSLQRLDRRLRPRLLALRGRIFRGMRAVR